MLMNLLDEDKEADVRKILDLLRAARQSNPSLRLILTGSIGLHNVLHRLQASGYRNRPVNDVRSLDVPPLERQHGVKLARALLLGEAIDCESVDETAYEIFEAVSGIPFLIHHVVDGLKRRSEPVVTADVTKIVGRGLRDPAMGWDLAQYGSRIRTHYPEAECPLALAILDRLCHGRLPISERKEQVRPCVKAGSDDGLQELFQLLRSDHYLDLDDQGAIGFRLEIVRNWWFIERGE